MFLVILCMANTMHSAADKMRGAADMMHGKANMMRGMATTFKQANFCLLRCQILLQHAQ